MFGKLKKAGDKAPAQIEQLAFVSPDERSAAFELAERALSGEDIDPKADELLLTTDTAADVAMFGRMLADQPRYNREAAVQVSHAITVNRAVAEDDYYTAVDDLKEPHEDAGAGFVGVQEFGAGTFYLYICVDRDLLLANLGGAEDVRVRRRPPPCWRRPRPSPRAGSRRVSPAVRTPSTSSPRRARDSRAVSRRPSSGRSPAGRRAGMPSKRWNASATASTRCTVRWRIRAAR